MAVCSELVTQSTAAAFSFGGDRVGGCPGRLRDGFLSDFAVFSFSDDTDPYQEANEFPPSPESWIGGEGGMEPSAGTGHGLPYD